YRLNLPERRVPAAVAEAAAPLVRIVPAGGAEAASSVLVETVKLAEDRSGDLVLRLYESGGARTQVRLELDAALSGGEVTAVDLLERPFGEGTPAFRSALDRDQDAGVLLSFRPFEIKTLRVRRPAWPARPGPLHPARPPDPTHPGRATPARPGRAARPR